MATVTHFTPVFSRHLICSKGKSHEEQALNLVCLDPLCRNNPLACCVCFTETHKYHKVVGLSKFIDDFKRNVHNVNKDMMQNKIRKHYFQVKEKVQDFKKHIMNQMANYEKAVDKYFEYLSSQLNIRSCIKSELGLELQPQKIEAISNKSQLQKSVRFILNNCLYDANLNMINTSDILKQNEERVSALIDKIVYMTGYCKTAVNQALSHFRFANTTLKNQKVNLNANLQRLKDSQAEPTSLKYYTNQKNRLSKLIQQTGSLILQENQKIQHMKEWEAIPKTQPEYLFGKHRNTQVKIRQNGRIISSTVHTQKPQYALAWPDINNQPFQIRQWSLKIKKCRDFASENTMAIGISRISDMQLAHYEGNPTNTLLITSQGYVNLNGKSQKTQFTFRQGDTVHFRYDPNYGSLELSKENGRKLTLKALGKDQPVYACVKFTYASDQVQFV